MAFSAQKEAAHLRKVRRPDFDRLRHRVDAFVKQLATTPPRLATITGIVFALSGWPLPVPVEKLFPRWVRWHCPWDCWEWEDR